MKIMDANVNEIEIKKPKCPECGSIMYLRDSKYGKFYGCVRYPHCQAIWKSDKDGNPIGTFADKNTKKWRVIAHCLLDSLWKSGEMARTDAYKWVQKTMNINEKEAHISMFDTHKCKELIKKIGQYLYTIP